MPDPQPNCCCPTLPLDAISIPSYDCASAGTSPNVDYWEVTIPFTTSGCFCDLSPVAGFKTLYPFGFCQWIPPSNQTPRLCGAGDAPYNFSFTDYRIFYSASPHPTYGNLYLRIVIDLSDLNTGEPTQSSSLSYGALDPVYVEQPITLNFIEKTGCITGYPDTIVVIPYRS